MSQISLLSAPAPPEPTAGPDNAYTPDDLAEALVQHLVKAHGLKGPVWEQHAGGGSWVRALAAAGVGPIIASDIDPALGWRVWDAARGPIPGELRAEAIVGNPPWSIAHTLLAGALRDAERLVAWILPSSIFGRVGAGGWDYPLRSAWPDETVDLGRISYGGPGRDHGGGVAMTDSSLVVWRKRGGSWQGRGIRRRMIGRDPEPWPPPPPYVL